MVLFDLFTDAVIHAAWFFFGAGLLMSVAGLLCLVGHCLRKWKILTFVAGVVFIFAGKKQSKVISILARE